MKTEWFGPPRDTIEEAQGDHKPINFFDPTNRPALFFDPAAVFEHEGKYVVARIKEDNWPPQQTAEHMATLGYKMVACCDSLLGMWKPYPFPPKAV